jgi:hypothetical protein
MNVDLRNKLISAVLFVVIVVLAYFLYDSIVTPYKKVLEQQAMTEAVRTRMSNVRTALNRYKNENKKFPVSLDSLVYFIKTDSATVAVADSLFQEKAPYEYNPDSFVVSQRTGKTFFYQVNDTLRPPIYLLKDPDSNDAIGDTLRTTSLNAASWE